jgi:hypothetical protein
MHPLALYKLLAEVPRIGRTDTSGGPVLTT